MSHTQHKQRIHQNPCKMGIPCYPQAFPDWKNSYKFRSENSGFKGKFMKKEETSGFFLPNIFDITYSTTEKFTYFVIH